MTDAAVATERRYINPVRDEEVWTESRGRTIGGSDAGTLMRWNSYGAVTRLWKEKSGQQEPDFEMNRWIEWGNNLEPVLLQVYSRTVGAPVLGRTLEGDPAIFWPELKPPTLLDVQQHWALVRWLNPVKSRKRTYVHANVDGYRLGRQPASWAWAGNHQPIVIGDEVLFIDKGLEVKTTMADNRPKWDWDPPPAYLAQCLHNRQVLREAGLHGIEFEIMVLVGGNDFGILPIGEYPHVVEEMLKRETQFDFCVTTMTKPRVQAWFPRQSPPSDEEESDMGFTPPAGGGNRVEIPPAPTGSHPAVFVDIVDRGMKDKTWNGETKQVHKISIHALLPNQTIPATNGAGEAIPDDLVGKPFMLSIWFTYSLSEKANLRKFLRNLRGHDLTDEEEALLKKGEFDIEPIIMGANAIVTVSHTAKDGKTYANIEGVVPFMDGMAPIPIPDDWVRFADRDKQQQPSQTGAQAAAGDDDEIPF